MSWKVEFYLMIMLWCGQLFSCPLFFIIGLVTIQHAFQNTDCSIPLLKQNKQMILMTNKGIMGLFVMQD